MIKIRITYDNARSMAQYLSIQRPWPEWEFPGMEIEFYDPDPEDEEDEGFSVETKED